MENKQKVIAGIIFVIVVVVAVYFGVIGNKNNQVGNVGQSNNANVKEEEKTVGEVIAPNASPIKEGQVVTPTGKPADNSAVPGSENAPAQSVPLAKEEVPPTAIKLEISTDSGFKPNTFTVKAKSAVTLSLTGTDDQVHVLRFDDPSLNAVAIGLGPKMTRLINFNAPQEPGEYTFHDDVPGHQNLTGKMIVK